MRPGISTATTATATACARSASLLAALLLAPAVGAQQLGSEGAGLPLSAPSVQASPVLTIDQDRLFAGSLFGQRVTREIEARSQTLAAENRTIETQLADEEKALTLRRDSLAAAEFRPLADAFDGKVVGIRSAQAEKLRQVNQQRERERQAFLQAALPVLGELVREAGAVVILDSRAVFIAANRIDITGTAIIRLDQTIGAGTAIAPEPLSQLPDSPATP